MLPNFWKFYFNILSHHYLCTRTCLCLTTPDLSLEQNVYMIPIMPPYFLHHREFWLTGPL